MANKPLPLDLPSLIVVNSDSQWLSGWWYTNPSEKYEFVSWDDDIPNIWKVIIQSCSKPPTSCGAPQYYVGKNIDLYPP